MSNATGLNVNYMNKIICFGQKESFLHCYTHAMLAYIIEESNMSDLITALLPLQRKWTIQKVVILFIAQYKKSVHLICNLVETTHRGARPFNRESEAADGGSRSCARQPHGRSAATLLRPHLHTYTHA